MAKITTDQEMNFKEHSIMKSLSGQKVCPEIYAGGMFHVQGQEKISFIIMELLGANID